MLSERRMMMLNSLRGFSSLILRNRYKLNYMKRCLR